MHLARSIEPGCNPRSGSRGRRRQEQHRGVDLFYAAKPPEGRELVDDPTLVLRWSLVISVGNSREVLKS